MSRICFREKNFKPESLRRIEQMQEVVEDYSDQGFKLTARQLYYVFVSHDWIPNTERSYKNFTSLLADARYAGMIDWDAIEDRGRVPTMWRQYDSMDEAIDGLVRNFRLPRWRGQENYVELWVEKQALAGVLEPLAHEFHVTLMVNKGYSSASSMFDAAQRFRRETSQNVSYFERKKLQRLPFLLYLGDHDPSGEDMVRDIEDRLHEFGVQDLQVEKLALTMEQIKKHRPPPNPAKTTDSRFEAYERKHGENSWEVDALPPNVLQAIIRTALEDLIDVKKMDAVKAEETKDKKGLVKAWEKAK